MSASTDHYAELRDEHRGRSVDVRSTDQAAVRAIAQAAVDVEMFTLPLYMTSMFSIYGTHQIVGSNNFYEGRWWPGRATARPTGSDDANTEVFNLVFRVFIEEMLHLQLAANLCSVLGQVPSFTELSPPPGYAWPCYDDKPEIPHIIDFRDTIPPYTDTLVRVGAMTQEQAALFIAIEETQQDAAAIIQPSKRDKYFPTVPFAGWQEGDPLPMFGTIGAMYLALWQYLNITYADDTNLWASMYQPHAQQRDLFNSQTASHPEPEYPGFSSVVDPADPAPALLQVMAIIDAITDQGEGKGVTETMRRLLGSVQLLDVEPQYRADYQALQADYQGTEDAYARGSEPNVSFDHLEAFQSVAQLIEQPGFQTWEQWHRIPGNVWTAQMLQPDPNVHGPYEDVLPTAQSIADALNALKHDDHDAHYATISQAATGSIAGINKVLGDYWAPDGPDFPYPSMYGSGDRLSICWAVFGIAPDLTEPVQPRPTDQLNHSCQGLDLNPATRNPARCADVALYHTCKGSNECAAEGGCGFVHSTSGGGNCSQVPKVSFSSGCGLCGGGKGGAPYSAPSDNKCYGLGGCAVPISASQLYPAPEQGPATMDVYDNGPDGPTLLGTIEYEEGQPVYDVAWEAYIQVLEHRQEPLPPKPDPPSIYRLAFPPST